MSKAPRRSALRQPSNIFLLVIAGLAGLVIAGLVISRAHFATADASAITQDMTAEPRYADLTDADRKALLDVEIAAASAATRLNGTSEDRKLATTQLGELATSVGNLGNRIPPEMRKNIAGQIEQAHMAALQGQTDVAVRTLRELSSRLASARSA